MKNLFYLVISCFFLSCNHNSKVENTTIQEENTISTTNESLESINQNSQEKIDDKKLQTIEDIREEYKTLVSKINDKKLDSISFQFECYEASGEVSYFLENGQLRVIKYSNGYEHGGVTKEYFLKNEKPFFIYHETGTWNFDVDARVENAPRDDIKEERFYIIDENLIKCLEKKFTMRSAAKQNPTSATVANQEAKCPQISELLKDYRLVLKHRNQTGKMECLEN